MTDFWATDSKRILISYCERDHENTGFIAGLVSDLNREGFCVVWDHGNPAPDKWPQWFKENVKNADFVLDVFSENFKKCWDDTEGYGSGGIVEEIAYLKDNLKRDDKDIENWKVIPVFRTGERNRFKLAKLREAARPKGFLGSGNTFGLRTQQTQLIRYLRREKPPIDYGRFGKFGLKVRRLFEFAANVRWVTGWLLRSFGMLILSGLLCLLAWFAYEYHDSVSSFFKIATQESQTKIINDFSKHESLLTQLKETSNENAKLIVGLKTDVSLINSISATDIKNLIQQWEPKLSEETTFTQISNVQKEFGDFEREILEIQEKLNGMLTLAQLKAELGELELFVEKEKADAQAQTETFIEIKKQILNVNKTLVLVQQKNDLLKTEIGSCKTPNDGDPTQESQTFPTRQSWFFYNMGYKHFFAQDYRTAIGFLDQGLAMGTEDARYYFLRGLASRRLGYAYEGDLARAIQLERIGQPERSVVSQSLERIQGNERLWLEEQREETLTTPTPSKSNR